MLPLAQKVLTYIRRQGLLKAGDRAGVAVSGGADSVALLRILLELRRELGCVLAVLHFNHELRGPDSDADEQFVIGLAEQHGLEVICDRADVRAYSAKQRLSLEAAARTLRYQFFERILSDAKVSRIATAHTRDDQAETVLLRMTRGAGTRGLAGIYPELRRLSESSGGIVRPLLRIRRNEIEGYLGELHQAWREDESNRDLKHARNRIRHEILPMLERDLNPSIRETLADTAEIARAEEEFWSHEVGRHIADVWNHQTSAIELKPLLAQPLALQRRVVRAAAESLGIKLNFQEVESILERASGSAKTLCLPNGWLVERTRSELCFTPGSGSDQRDYEYPLRVPGKTAVPEAGACFEASLVGAKQNPGSELLDPALLGPELRVRNWRAGDRFWPAHAKNPKKIKELLQEKHATGRERTAWPVIAKGAEVVWLRGFHSPEKLRARKGSLAVLIRETRLD